MKPQGPLFYSGDAPPMFDTKTTFSDAKSSMAVMAKITGFVHDFPISDPPWGG